MLRPGKNGVMGWKDFLLGVKAEFKKDRVTDSAGMVAYSAFLAVFPFLLFLVSLASLVINPAQAASIVQQLGEVAPPQVASILGDQIKSLSEKNSGGILTFGALAAIWAASAGMIALTKALNTAYDVEEKRKFLKLRGLAIGMVFVSAVMVLLAAGLAIVLPVVANSIGGPVGVGVKALSYPLSGLIMLLLVGLLYWILPDVRPRPFQFITFGSLSAVVLWLLASFGFSLYVQNFAKYEASYGAIGGIIVFLLWMYISANVMLLGAEMNAVLEEHAKATGQVATKGQTKPTLTSSGQDVPAKHVSESGQRPAQPRPPRGERHNGPGHRTPQRASTRRTSAQRGVEDWGGQSSPGVTRPPNRPKPRSLVKSLGQWAVFSAAASLFGRRRGQATFPR